MNRVPRRVRSNSRSVTSWNRRPRAERRRSWLSPGRDAPAGSRPRRRRRPAAQRGTSAAADQRIGRRPPSMRAAHNPAVEQLSVVEAAYAQPPVDGALSSPCRRRRAGGAYRACPVNRPRRVEVERQAPFGGSGAVLPSAVSVGVPRGVEKPRKGQRERLAQLVSDLAGQQQRRDVRLRPARRVCGLPRRPDSAAQPGHGPVVPLGRQVAGVRSLARWNSTARRGGSARRCRRTARRPLTERSLSSPSALRALAQEGDRERGQGVSLPLTTGSAYWPPAMPRRSVKMPVRATPSNTRERLAACAGGLEHGLAVPWPRSSSPGLPCLRTRVGRWR